VGEWVSGWVSSLTETATTAPGRRFSTLSERYSRILALLGKRLIQIPVVLFVVSVMTFWLIQLVPGDPGRNALGQYATPSQVEAWDVSNGLTGSVVTRYLHWLGGFLSGNWGTSFVYLEPSRELVLGHLLYLGGLLGGSAVVETLFNYPGLGALMVSAAERKDVVLLTDGVMVTGVIALLALLLTDICLILMDPRIRFENSES
jgi:peptide/nickel transport system permease protein